MSNRKVRVRASLPRPVFTGIKSKRIVPQWGPSHCVGGTVGVLGGGMAQPSSFKLFSLGTIGAPFGIDISKRERKVRVRVRVNLYLIFRYVSFLEKAVRIL